MGPSPLFTVGCAFMCTTAGSKKESVFPLPVSAIPIRSWPLRTIGNAVVRFNKGVENG